MKRNFAEGKNRSGHWTRREKYPIILLITPLTRIMSAAKSEKCFSEFSLNDFRIRPDTSVKRLSQNAFGADSFTDAFNGIKETGWIEPSMDSEGIIN
jgi:hypothetical protein